MICWRNGWGVRTGLLLLAGALFGLTGCGSSGPQMVPVSGKVTLDGGKVPGPGFIYFTSLESHGGVGRPGTAEFDAEGNYTAMTFKKGDGLMPGKYLLRVDCWKSPPNMDGKPVVSFLPNKYQDAAKSDLELIVKPEDSRIDFEVKLSSK